MSALGKQPTRRCECKPPCFYTVGSTCGTPPSTDRYTRAREDRLEKLAKAPDLRNHIVGLYQKASIAWIVHTNAHISALFQIKEYNIGLNCTVRMQYAFSNALSLPSSFPPYLR